MAKGNGQRIFILVIVVVFFLSSFAFLGAIILDEINKDDTPTSAEIQKQLQDQLAEQKKEENKVDEKNKLQGTKLEGFTPVAKVEKLKVIDTKEGTGEAVKPGEKVTAHYTGALAKDGTIFQSSYDTGQPVPFGLDQVIKGWQEGIPGMKVGGERRLLIPASEAYGENGTSGIPPNSDLVFDVVLVKIGE